MPARSKSSRRATVPDEEIREKVLELADRFYSGSLAPNLSRFSQSVKGWPNPQKLLRQRGYAPDARGKYSDAWAELVRRLTGLKIYQSVYAPPPAPTLATLDLPPTVEWYLSRQAALSEGLPVASWREVGGEVYYLIR